MNYQFHRQRTKSLIGMELLLRYTPFNDFSGTYDGTQLKITMEGAPSGEGNLQINEHRSFVVDENTIFFYMGHRDIDYLDRKLYKLYVQFTDEEAPGTMLGAKKLKIWSDNSGEDGNNYKVAIEDKDENKPYEAYYVKWEEMDEVKPYMKHIYISFFISVIHMKIIPLHREPELNIQ